MNWQVLWRWAGVATWLFCAAVQAQDRSGVAEGELDRVKLLNFSDVSDVSLQELVGDETSPVRFRLLTFGDARFGVEAPREVRPAFGLGQFGLLATGSLGDSVRALAELVIEADTGGNTMADLERLQVRWASERFSVSAGRMHSPMGFWNTSFHHGTWIHPTIARPAAVAFEDDDGILPVHAVGLAGAARLPVRNGTLDCDLVVANGRGTTHENVLAHAETNLAKSVLLRVQEVGVGIQALRVGATFSWDRIAAAPAEVRPALPDVAIDEIIGNVFAAYVGTAFTTISEAYLVVHRAAGRQWMIWDGFVYAGYRVGPVTPYVLAELRRLEGGPSPYLMPDPTASGPSSESFVSPAAGIRHDVTAWSSLKAEYRLRVAQGGATSHTVLASWSFVQ